HPVSTNPATRISRMERVAKSLVNCIPTSVTLQTAGGRVANFAIVPDRFLESDPRVGKSRTVPRSPEPVSTTTAAESDRCLDGHATRSGSTPGRVMT
ncbi:hypothetical protein J7S33_17155, partial [Saccharothrix algeriensis]